MNNQNHNDKAEPQPKAVGSSELLGHEGVLVEPGNKRPSFLSGWLHDAKSKLARTVLHGPLAIAWKRLLGSGDNTINGEGCGGFPGLLPKDHKLFIPGAGYPAENNAVEKEFHGYLDCKLGKDNWVYAGEGIYEGEPVTYLRLRTYPVEGSNDHQDGAA